MRIILDTDKKTITVPWNYQDKLNAMNAIIAAAGGQGARSLDFKGYINDMWNYCMENSDACLKTADKPTKKGKK